MINSCIPFPVVWVPNTYGIAWPNPILDQKFTVCDKWREIYGDFFLNRRSLICYISFFFNLCLQNGLRVMLWKLLWYATPKWKLLLICTTKGRNVRRQKHFSEEHTYWMVIHTYCIQTKCFSKYTKTPNLIYYRAYWQRAELEAPFGNI